MSNEWDEFGEEQKGHSIAILLLFELKTPSVSRLDKHFTMSSSSSSIVKQVLVNSPLRELPPAAQAASLAVIIPVLAVVLNVLSQLVSG